MNAVLNPGQAGVYFDSGGYRLLGTLFLARGEDSKPTAVLLHGVPGIEKNYDLAHSLRAAGWNSLIFHYRGCWGSAGRYSFRTILQDTRASLDFLCSGIFPQVDIGRLVFIGHSLGAWAAVLGAWNDERVRAVAAIAPLVEPGELHFSLEEAGNRFTPWLQGLLPADFLSEWQTLAQMEKPIERVVLLAPRPLLVLHGAQDALVPVDQGERLCSAAGEPKRLLVHPQADHAFVWQREWLIGQVLDWLEEL